MIDDLKIIKNKYGENMSKLCRELFPTILDNPGQLSDILLSHFYPNHFLYNDILSNDLLDDFRDYIYSFTKNNNVIIEDEKRTPYQIFEEIGYKLYECQTESDVQNFKKYYDQRELLCTFRGNRLKKCYVFFAVKNNAMDIKREDFNNPKRQDEYGTSVLSIQFTKDESHTLSIKNRYNHSVTNPDSTFANNLENISKGLTSAFYNTYGLKQNNVSNNFEIPDYVLANDGKYYKYNYEINNIYYCPDNIIIENFEVKEFPKEKYIIADYFIIDLQNKEIKLYDEFMCDSFVDDFKKIKNIEVINTGINKKVIVKTFDEKAIEITLDNKNKIIEYDNKYVKKIMNYFLSFNDSLQKINLLNVEIIEDYFLYSNSILTNINIVNAKFLGNYFLYNNLDLSNLIIPNVHTINNSFMYYNKNIVNLVASNLQTIGNSFLFSNNSLIFLNLPNLLSIGDSFLYNNTILEYINIPKIWTINGRFLYKNNTIQVINCKNLQIIGDSFLASNNVLNNINLPSVKIIGINASPCITKYKR